MFLRSLCPNCDARLKISEDRLGARVKCPSCGVRFIAEAPEEPPAEAPARRRRPRRRVPLPSLSSAATPRAAALEATNVSILMTGLFGALATAGFYGVVVLPLTDTFVARLFLRGWVSVGILLLTFWSISIMVLKFLNLYRQKQALLYDLLPQDLADEIRPEDATAFMEHIGALPLRSERSFLINRLLRGLQHFRFRRNAQEVAGLLNTQAELDAVAVEASYTMLRSFIWAVPILGFIGTVIGIGDAVDSFSATVEGAGSINEIKSALGGVTGGLGTAFDTTLIALLMSIIVMIPMSWLHKQEEDLLSKVGGYSNEELLMRLDDGRGAVEEADPSGGAARGDEEWFRRWTESLRAFGTEMVRDLSGVWEQADARLRQQGERYVEKSLEGWEEVRVALKALTDELAAKRNGDGSDGSGGEP